ncbi:MAG: ABC transporter permease subunit [Acidimicrobiales bacterium]
MLTSIFAKTIWERRRSIAWWMLGMAALAGLTIAFYPSIRDDTESFEDLFDAFPPELLNVFGIEDAASLVTATGLVNSRLYSGIGPVIVAVLGISIGTGAIAGEEEDGTLDLLLAQPVTRTQIIVEKMAAAVVLVGAVVITLFVVLSVLNPIVDLDFSFSGILGANIALGLFSLVFCGFALAVGAATGNRGLTVGISAGMTATLFFVNGLAPLVDEIAWMQKLTPFYWLQNPNPLANGLDLWATLLFLAVLGALMAAAIWGFNRRDLAV